MVRQNQLPVAIAIFIIGVGTHSLASTVMALPWLTYEVHPPMIAIAVSAVLTLAGIYFLTALPPMRTRAQQGSTKEPRIEKDQLEPAIREVRKRAMEKVATKSYLARVAENDSDPEVRRKALEQLEEMAD